MNHSLAISLIQLRYGKGAINSRRQCLLQRQLGFFYGEHRFLKCFQQYFNSKVISDFSLTTLLTNILLQIILLNLLLRREMEVTESALIVGFLSFQTFFLIQACQVGVTWTDALYSPSPFLFQAQSLLRRPTNAFEYPRHLSAKLRLMTNIELLCTKEKELFTLGSFTEISSSALFQVNSDFFFSEIYLNND